MFAFPFEQKGSFRILCGNMYNPCQTSYLPPRNPFHFNWPESSWRKEFPDRAQCRNDCTAISYTSEITRILSKKDVILCFICFNTPTAHKFPINKLFRNANKLLHGRFSEIMRGKKKGYSHVWWDLWEGQQGRSKVCLGKILRNGMSPWRPAPPELRPVQTEGLETGSLCVFILFNQVRNPVRLKTSGQDR